MCKLSLGSTQLAVQSVLGVYVRVKWLEHDTHSSLLSSIEFKKVQSGIVIP